MTTELKAKFQKFLTELSKEELVEFIMSHYETLSNLLQEANIPIIPQENETETVSDSLDVKVSKTLQQIGVSAHLKGYKYLRYALCSLIENPELINGITKFLYPRIATEFNTSSSKVERAIRHTIENAWKQSNNQYRDNIFINTDSIRRIPTNLEFLATILDAIQIGKI